MGVGIGGLNYLALGIGFTIGTQVSVRFPSFHSSSTLLDIHVFRH